MWNEETFINHDHRFTLFPCQFLRNVKDTRASDGDIVESSGSKADICMDVFASNIDENFR